MKPTARILRQIAGLAISAWVAAGVVWAQEGYSHVRIVRLSFVEGTVTVQRPDVADWAAASVNTPIQEGFKLATAESSFAEVEFENGSTARTGEQTEIEFTQLALAPSGAKVNRLTLLQGYATFHVLPEGEDVLEIKAADATLVARGKAFFRVDLDQGMERVEVFKGTVETSSPFGTWNLTRDQVLTLQPGATPADTLAEGITQDAWDQWVEQREAQVAAGANSPNPSGYPYNDVRSVLSEASSGPLYGWNDLGMYGTWSYIPSYGYGWIPSVPVGWMPFAIGHWSWYPGLGWTWISGDPWGWLPYHYGDWAFFNNVGWCWFPSNLGAWSPATVNWYQGPDWVGWSPRPLGGVSGCPTGQRCTVAVHTHVFQDGGSVTPHTALNVDWASGTPVNRLDVQPGQLGRLPGPPVTTGFSPAAPSAPAGGVTLHTKRVTDSAAGGMSASEPGTHPATVISSWGTSPRRGTPAPDARVVYDPVEGRWVNSATAPSAASTGISSTPVVHPVYEAPRPVMAPSEASTTTRLAPPSSPVVPGAANDRRVAPAGAPANAPARSDAWGGNRQAPQGAAPSAARGFSAAEGPRHESGAMGRAPSGSGSMSPARSEGAATGGSRGGSGGASGDGHTGGTSGTSGTTPKH